jgi:hypothetical protein
MHTKGKGQTQPDFGFCHKMVGWADFFHSTRAGEMAKISNPYAGLSNGTWMRGNLHCHSTRSDGTRSPQGVIDDYAKRGYDFLMLSDHDILSAPEDYAQWESRGLVFINGNEVSANGPHILHVDADRRVEPLKDRQKVMDQVRAGRGFAVAAHPNWTTNFDHCTIENLLNWTGYIGVEVFNGLVQTHSGSAYALDKYDLALSKGKKLWAFANDDSHYGTTDIELGWNVVYTHDKSAKGLVEAMRAGRFYASTGVTILDVKVEGMTITVKTKDAQRIAAVIDWGKRIAQVEGPEITVTMPEKAMYIRFECFGAGEKRAWTQPFYSVSKVFLRDWEVSDIQAGVCLGQATWKTPGDQGMGWKAMKAIPEGQVGEGFMEVHGRMEGKQGVVYLSTVVNAGKAQTGKVHLGFDGPVKAWLNGKELFYGPGSPPAVLDRVGVFGEFKAGENRLTVALDSDGGKSWGVMARVELD